MKKVVLRNFQSPGDILMLTAAVRDLHACYPGRFLTDVRSSCPDLWLHNPSGPRAALLAVHLRRQVRLHDQVVVAGGREPPHFTAYPHHQYLHTVGALRCCDQGGCWKSRVVALGDGDPKDQELCIDVVGDLPRCMHMITSADVVRAVERYYEGGALPPL